MKIKCNCESSAEIEFSVNENGQYHGECQICFHRFGFKNIIPNVIHNPFRKGESKITYRRPRK